MIYEPKQKGITILRGIPLREVSRYINWTYFFSAWKLAGRYDGIEEVCMCASCEEAFLQKAENREKAKEALSLFRDAQRLLSDVVENKLLTPQAVFAILKVKSENEGIVFYPDNAESIYIPMLRQQQTGKSGYSLSLADYVSPKGDYAGVFALSVGGADEIVKKYEAENDMYNAFLLQTVADRLAEATSEWLHEQVRKKYWGYAAGENISIKEMYKAGYQGIRPAVGYPSLPDQSVIFDLDKILDLGKIGISITENGAMHPTSSICGLMFAHPQTTYFVIDKIGADQLEDYARRKGISVQEAKRWLSAYL